MGASGDRAILRIPKGLAVIDYSNDRLIALPEVMNIAGYGKTKIYAWVRQGTFPEPCHPGGASSRWSEAEVRAWKAEQLARRPISPRGSV